MYLKDSYSDRILGKVEVLASRVHLLKARMANQKVSVRIEHYWELANIHRRFAEFKWLLEELKEDDDFQLTRDQENLDWCWDGLMNAIDGLLAALSWRKAIPST